MSETENLSIRFEIDINGEATSMEMDNLAVLPRTGDVVECNYVHGTKVEFEVIAVRHFLYSSGHDIIQNITVRGRAI